MAARRLSLLLLPAHHPRRTLRFFSLSIQPGLPCRLLRCLLPLPATLPTLGRSPGWNDADSLAKTWTDGFSVGWLAGVVLPVWTAVCSFPGVSPPTADLVYALTLARAGMAAPSQRTRIAVPLHTIYLNA